MKLGNFFKDNKWLPYAKAGCVIVLFYVVLTHINLLFVGIQYGIGFIKPVLIGLVVAYIMDPLVNFIEKTLFSGIKGKNNLRRMLAVTTAVLSVILLVVIFFVSLIPQLAKSITTFYNNVYIYSDSLQKLIYDITEFIGGFGIELGTVTEKAEEMVDNIAKYLTNNANRIVSQSIVVGKNIFTVLISFILAIYMLFDKEKLMNSFRRLLKAILSKKKYVEAGYFWSRCNNILIRYIAGDILDGVIVGVINFVFMTAFRMDYAILVSVIVGVTNLAPTFGPIAGGVLGGLILLLVNPWHSLWFIIFTIILQTLDGYVIKPKLFGNSLGISSLWILVAIIVFGRMFGIIGILIAIPLAAIFDIVYKEIILRELEKRREEKDKAIREAEAKKAAAIAAQKAATEAIKAVVKKDSDIQMDDKLKEKLASDVDVKSDDI